MLSSTQQDLDTFRIYKRLAIAAMRRLEWPERCKRKVGKTQAKYIINGEEPLQEKLET